MEFEEMQVIWNSEAQENLYVINEATLHKYIRHKGRSVGRMLSMVDLMMVAVNLIVGIVLIVDAYGDNEQGLQFVLAAMYLAYSVYALVRRHTRRKEEVHFAQTIVGELDKAIWQADYLIRQGRSILIWYGLPPFIVAGIILFPRSPLWALGLLLVVLPATHFAGRWEINKFYRPKKRELEKLREKIVECA